MNISDITLLTATFNNDMLTGMMIKSLYKQLDYIPNICVIDNGNKIKCSDDFKTLFNVIDNFNYGLLSNEQQPSRNHAKSIDYSLKNAIKTKWCLLVDNDVLFKPGIKEFLLNLNDNEFDVCGEIGWDFTPPNRLFPYLCLINVDKMKKENINYFDRNRIIVDDYYDTGASFYEDITSHKWRIKHIKLNNYINHLKGGMLRNKDINQWLYYNMNLWK